MPIFQLSTTRYTELFSTLVLSATVIFQAACGAEGPATRPADVASTDGVDGSSGERPAPASDVDAGETAGDESTGTSGEDAPHEVVCGDGQLGGDEVCDDGGANGNYGACNVDCTGPGPRCGDGIIQGDVESCDVALGSDSDACNAACQRPGTVLEVFHETLTVGSPSGVSATWWNGRATAVFGGSLTSVWEFDRDPVAPSQLRTIAIGLLRLVGAAGLSGGALVVADANDRRAWWLNAELGLIETFEDQSEDVYGNPVGLAGFDDGTSAIASAHYDNSSSGFWLRGFGPQGHQAWAELESFSDDSYLSRRFARVGDDRAVLLAATPNGAVVRVYTQGGDFLSESPVVGFGINYRELCSGVGGFYAVGQPQGGVRRLQGFDEHATPTLVAAYAQTEDSGAGFFGCVVRDDGDLVVVQPYGLSGGTSVVHLQGYHGDQPRWENELVVDANIWDAPAILLDEAHHRAWVFVGGTTLDNERSVSAYVIAI